MKQIIKPPSLNRGDLVAVVAPASNLKADYLARGIAELERLGFKAEYEPEILTRDRYTAGSDERRASELIRAFENPDVGAVWCARGGYGTMRIFDLIDDDVLKKTPKIFIGYSDITALHLYLYKRFGWVTFHGPMVAKDLEGGIEHYDELSLRHAISGDVSKWIITSPAFRILHGGGVVSGRLLGGCLTLINSLIGTPFDLDTTDSILFLEDTNVRPFAIDRMLTQLRLAGKFEKVRAIIFGEMLDCIQNVDQGYSLDDVLRDCTSDLGIPVAAGLRSGHTSIGNLTLPLGVQASFDSSFPVLTINEPAVV